MRHPVAPRFHQRGRACPEQANARRRGDLLYTRGVVCFETSANSLFRNILRASSCGSGFYGHAPISQPCKSLGENILEEQRKKKLQRYTRVSMTNGLAQLNHHRPFAHAPSHLYEV